jgi:hypothetical protein
MTWGDLFKTPCGYMKDSDGTWQCHAPCEGGGTLGNLSAHKVVEHEDGTITVSPSILIRSGDGQGGWIESFHGYLEHGVWRAC